MESDDNEATETSKRTGIIRILAGVVVALAICAVALWMYVGRRDFGVEPMPFDSAVWKRSPAEASAQSVRLRMVDDLLTNLELEGMTRDEIVELLGEPDETEEFKEFDLVYRLGQERSPLGVDGAWLALWLDEEKQVVADVRLKVKRND